MIFLQSQEKLLYLHSNNMKNPNLAWKEATQ